MATEYKMWAVEAPLSVFNRTLQLLAIEESKRAAKNTALAFAEPHEKWSYVAENYGWRVRPCTVTVPDEGER